MLNTMDEIIKQTRSELEKHPEQAYDILTELYILGQEDAKESVGDWNKPA